MMSESIGIALAERGMIPLPGLRLGVRRLLRQRLRDAEGGPDVETFKRELESSPLAIATDEANEQHYEVPPKFFETVLGPHLKYSGAFWPDGTASLAEAEEAMLALTCERAGIEDGQDILELGCGWGSLTLFMARQFPGSRITAVSNSAPQRRFIESHAPANVQVITADMNDFDTESLFDRIVSVEMFEHMRNYRELLGRIRKWMRADARLFVHVFCHRKFAYPYETDGDDNWMGRHFFTGGIMPSLDLLPRFDEHLEAEEQWAVDGTHYSRTARAWRENLEARREKAMQILAETYGPDEAGRWYHRWRMFFLACEELFGYRDGSEWLVGHYRFAPRPAA
jgi:cyclopropane-fatty-acyl-phospholipid synthase